MIAEMVNYDIEVKHISGFEEFILLGLPLFLFVISTLVVLAMLYIAFRLFRKLTLKDETDDSVARR